MTEFKVGRGDRGHKDLHLELTKLLVSDDVEEVLKKVGHWNFLELFEGYDVEVCHQMENNWIEGYVMVGTFYFEISPTILAKISSLVDEGLKITRDKHPQQIELDFFSSSKRIGWDRKYIMREGLPQPW